MKKSRVVITDADAAIHKAILDNGLTSVDHLEGLGATIPAWASVLLIAAKKSVSKIDIAYFEDVKDFFLWYTKVLIVGGDSSTVDSFKRLPGGDWQAFAPPTLIGIDLKTKLR